MKVWNTQHYQLGPEKFHVFLARQESDFLPWCFYYVLLEQFSLSKTPEFCLVCVSQVDKMLRNFLKLFLNSRDFKRYDSVHVMLRYKIPIGKKAHEFWCVTSLYFDLTWKFSKATYGPGSYQNMSLLQ